MIPILVVPEACPPFPRFPGMTMATKELCLYRNTWGLKCSCPRERRSYVAKKAKKAPATAFSSCRVYTCRPSKP